MPLVAPKNSPTGRYDGPYLEFAKCVAWMAGIIDESGVIVLVLGPFDSSIYPEGAA